MRSGVIGRRLSTSAGGHVGRMMGSASIVLAMGVTVLGAACASGGRLSPGAAPSSGGGRRADVAPGTWDRVAALSSGAPIVVTLMDGASLSGAFRALRPDELRVMDSVGQDVTLPRSEIERILLRDDRDRVTDGALIGAGIGLATAVTILALAAAGDGHVLASARWGAPLLLSAIGGVVGAFVDRAHRGDEVIYVRP